MFRKQHSTAFATLLLGAVVFLHALPQCLDVARAEDDASALWIRYPAISPDGKQIAFSFRGDLWTVPSIGGTARPLSSHLGYESMPVWSPDSRQIAFASDRHGNLDVFVMDAAGGPSRRLTLHSANDLPTAFTRDGERVLFVSRRQDAPQATIPHPVMSELYSVSTKADRPRQLITTPAERARFAPNGKQLVYQDYKGFEDYWRKHHTSSVTRDIWLWTAKSGKHRKLTQFPGEDRDPVWAPDGKTVYYLSEASGSFNVWQLNPQKTKQAPVQVTHHAPHPVRFLSISDAGTLAYAYNGELWLKAPDADPAQVKLSVVADQRSNEVEHVTLRERATEFAVSANEAEIAFIVRGELFVSSVQHNTTRRVTNTPEQERSVGFSRDGRTLYYAGERNGSWNLYQTTITREDEREFSTATLLTETALLTSDHETFQPLLSPDGKQLAFVEDRDTIRMLDLSTRKASTLVPARLNYSYTDGDVRYAWSPDSKWLAFTFNANNRWLQDVGVVNLASGKISNISNSGYSENAPLWAPNRDALLFISDRRGRRNHGSWGSDDDVFALYLTQDAFERASLSAEDWERRKKDKQRATADKKPADGQTKGQQPDKPADKQPKPMSLDLNDLAFRLKRLTLHSAPIGSYALSPDGETLAYLAKVESGYDLWVCRVRKRTTSKALSLKTQSAGDVIFAQDGKSVFLRTGTGKISKVTLPATGGKATSKPIAFAAEMTIHGAAERAHMFEHAWRQAGQKFYDPKLHGVDWSALKANYRRFLPNITNNRDFAELLSEMLGELNASHTGARYRNQAKNGDKTASLGVLFDVSHQGAGLKVAEVLKRGAADMTQTRMQTGTLITHLNGIRLTPDVNPWQLLNRQDGRPVRLTLSNPDKDGQSWEEVIKARPASTDTDLLYRRWVDGRRAEVHKLSNGRVGYVHVRGMNDASFRQVYQDVLGRNSDKLALVVDTRFNGGGWLHDDLVTFLQGRDYLYFVPRGKQKGQLGAEPFARWTRPVAVVQSESNYSDAHMFPYAFKQLGLGTLVGAPVPGTGTAVWWETMIDRSLVFGIPQVGMVTPDGKYLENTQLEPDVVVFNDPNAMQAGRDPQLAKAVEVLLKQIKAK